MTDLRMKKSQQLDRATVLLKAALDILSQCENSPVVLEVLGVTTFYDGTECDGACLKDDIEAWLESQETLVVQEKDKQSFKGIRGVLG